MNGKEKLIYILLNLILLIFAGASFKIEELLNHNPLSCGYIYLFIWGIVIIANICFIRKYNPVIVRVLSIGITITSTVFFLRLCFIIRFLYELDNGLFHAS